MADEDVEVVAQRTDEEQTPQGRHIMLDLTDAVEPGDRIG